MKTAALHKIAHVGIAATYMLKAYVSWDGLTMVLSFCYLILMIAVIIEGNMSR